jgi:hypothetical protein
MHGFVCAGNLLYYSKLQTVSVLHAGQILREQLLFEKGDVSILHHTQYIPIQSSRVLFQTVER